MKRHIFALAFLACLTVATLQAAAQTPPPQTVAIRAGRLIAPETGRETRVTTTIRLLTTPIRSARCRASLTRAVLEAGFTTVRDVGNEGNYACVSVARGIERGMIQGPTMLSAGRIIAPFGGQFGLQSNRRELGEPEYFFADSRDELRKAVRENAHFGAQLIKAARRPSPGSTATSRRACRSRLS